MNKEIIIIILSLFMLGCDRGNDWGVKNELTGWFGTLEFGMTKEEMRSNVPLWISIDWENPKFYGYDKSNLYYEIVVDKEKDIKPQDIEYGLILSTDTTYIGARVCGFKGK